MPDSYRTTVRNHSIYECPELSVFIKKRRGLEVDAFVAC